jgi:hypothetical protein
MVQEVDDGSRPPQIDPGLNYRSFVSHGKGDNRQTERHQKPGGQ